MIDTLEAYAIENIKDLGKLSEYSTGDPDNYNGKLIQKYNVNGISFMAIFLDGVLEKISFKGSLHKYFFGNYWIPRLKIVSQLMLFGICNPQPR